MYHPGSHAAEVHPAYFKSLFEDYAHVRDTLTPTQAGKWMWARMAYFFDGVEIPLPKDLQNSFEISEKKRLDSYRNSALNGAKNKTKNSDASASIPAETEILGTTEAATDSMELGTTGGPTVLKKEVTKYEEEPVGGVGRPTPNDQRRRASTSQAEPAESTLPVSGASRRKERRATSQAEAVSAQEHESALKGQLASSMGKPQLEEPGTRCAQLLLEYWEAFNIGREPTPEQKATYRRYCRSKTWHDIYTGQFIERQE